MPADHTWCTPLPHMTVALWGALRNERSWEEFCLDQEQQDRAVITQTETADADGNVCIGMVFTITSRSNPIPMWLRPLAKDSSVSFEVVQNWWRDVHDITHPMTQVTTVLSPSILVGRVEVVGSQWVEARAGGGCNVHSRMLFTVNFAGLGEAIAMLLANRAKASVRMMPQLLEKYMATRDGQSFLEKQRHADAASAAPAPAPAPKHRRLPSDPLRAFAKVRSRATNAPAAAAVAQRVGGEPHASSPQRPLAGADGAPMLGAAADGAQPASRSEARPPAVTTATTAEPKTEMTAVRESASGRREAPLANASRLRHRLGRALVRPFRRSSEAGHHLRTVTVVGAEMRRGGLLSASPGSVHAPMSLADVASHSSLAVATTAASHSPGASSPGEPSAPEARMPDGVEEELTRAYGSYGGSKGRKLGEGALYTMAVASAEGMPMDTPWAIRAASGDAPAPRSTYDDVLAVAGGAGGVATGGVAALHDDVKESQQSLRDAMAEPWANFTESMSRLTEDTAKGFVEGFGKGLGEVTEGLGENLGKLAEDTGKGLGGLGEGLEGLGKGIGEVTEGTVKGVAEGIGGFGENLGKLTEEAGKGLGEGIGRFAEDTGKGIEGIGQNINNFIKDVLPPSAEQAAARGVPLATTPKPARARWLAAFDAVRLAAADSRLDHGGAASEAATPLHIPASSSRTLEPTSTSSLAAPDAGGGSTVAMHEIGIDGLGAHSPLALHGPADFGFVDEHPPAAAATESADTDTIRTPPVLLAEAEAPRVANRMPATAGSLAMVQPPVVAEAPVAGAPVAEAPVPVAHAPVPVAQAPVPVAQAPVPVAQAETPAMAELVAVFPVVLPENAVATKEASPGGHTGASGRRGMWF